MTVKVVIAHKVYRNGKSQVGLRFTIDRKTKIVKLFNIEKKYFDQKKGRVKKVHRDSVQLNKMISKQLAEAERWLLECQDKGVIPRVEEFKNRDKSTEKLVGFIEKTAEGKEYRTRKKYLTTRNKVRSFDQDVRVDQIDYRWIKRFESKMREWGLSKNSIAKELSVIRTCMNEAVRSGLVRINPFSDYRIKRVKTFKVRLTTGEIDSLIEAGKNDAYRDAVNAWLLSFYFRGMRASDVISLEWSQIKDGKLITKAQKTSKVDVISIPQKASDILCIYDRSQRFVLPYLPEKIDLSTDRAKDKINSSNVLINKHLKRAAREAGIDKKVTMHTARHSFASVADKAGLSVNTIKDLLNHSSLDITETYLRELRRSQELDDAVEGLF